MDIDRDTGEVVIASMRPRRRRRGELEPGGVNAAVRSVLQCGHGVAAVENSRSAEIRALP